MYIDLSSNLSNINIYIIMSIIGIGTGYFCATVSNSYFLVKLAYVCSLLFSVSHPPTRLFVIGGLAFGYLYSKNQSFFDFSDWWAGYRYNQAIKRENRERARLETERARQQAEEALYRREQERQRREEEQRQQRAGQDKEKQKRDEAKQGEQRKAEEQTRRQEEQRKLEEEARRRAEEVKRKVEQATKDNRTPEQVLGIQPGFTYEELRKAYKVQCQRLHPDKWHDRPAHIREAMEEEQKRVNWAYGVLEKRFK